jgi:hypothetical protein
MPFLLFEHRGLPVFMLSPLSVICSRHVYVVVSRPRHFSPMANLASAQMAIGHLWVFVVISQRLYFTAANACLCVHLFD